jgi:hypothetical protein
MTFTPTVLTDAVITIGSTTISDHANKVEVPISVEEKDATTFGQTWKVRRGGLKDGMVNVTVLNDYTAVNLDEMMWALLGTVPTFDVRPTSGSVSSSNPKYTGSLFVKEWKPIVGSVGDLVTVDFGYPTSGVVTRGTS